MNTFTPSTYRYIGPHGTVTEMTYDETLACLKRLSDSPYLHLDTIQRGFTASIHGHRILRMPQHAED